MAMNPCGVRFNTANCLQPKTRTVCKMCRSGSGANEIKAWQFPLIEITIEI